MSLGAGQVATLVDLLRWRSSRQPEQIAFTILQSGATGPIELRYADLDRQARSIAGLLQQAGAAGQRAMLLFPPGHSYIAALFGCLYAGVTAVPAYPPRATRPMPRLQSIVADAHATFALTTGDIFAGLEERLSQTPDLAALRWLTTDSCDPALATAWQAPEIRRDSLALLQYTSGSTAAPKGVMLSHNNLLQNLALIQQCFETTADSRGVFWLPPYHDMGLIGGILQPLYCGGTATLMSPLTFLQRPIRWLEAISETRATISGAPNFAYDLCIAKTTPEQREQLDLSSWELAFTGAEPVRAETLDRFVAAFGPCGFRREAFYPCYGLAEATLLVTGGRKDAAPVVRAFADAALAEHRVVAAAPGSEDRRELVGCGLISASQQLAIVDAERLTPLPPDRIGEIWVAGRSVAQGYWNNAALTQQTFGAHLADSGAGPFLRTGDLGFVQDGEVFVTGRIKDLIIIRGRNHYPQDIELAVEQSHVALRPGSGAAVSVEVGGDERLVIVHEIERSHYNADLGAMIERIRQALAEQQELQAYAVVLIKAGTLPRTSSGKVQRHVCRADFLAGRLHEVACWRETALAGPVAGSVLPAPLEELEASEAAIAGWLARRFAATLKLDTIALDRPVASYGIDSLSAVELAHAAEEQFGVALSLESLLQGATIADLAAQIAALHGSSPTQVEPTTDTGLEHPLSVGQRALWFLQQFAPESTAYHISAALRVRSGLDETALRKTLQILALRHTALRSTFHTVEGLPVQRIHEQPQVTLTVVDGSGWTEPLLKERLSTATQQPFDLEYGPLWRVHLFLLRPSEYILLLTIHHIIADFWSLTVLAREFDLLYPQLCAGDAEPADRLLPPVALQYADYVRWQAAWLASTEGEQSLAYWRRQLRPEGTRPLPVLDLPTDYPRPAVQTYEGAAYPFDVPSALGDQLKVLSAEQGVTLYMTLLAALYVVLGMYTGQSEIVVGSPMTGRRRARLAQLVGYLTNPVVLRTDLAQTPSFSALLAQVRETVLAASAHQEFPFAALVDQFEPERDPSRSPLFQVMFVFQKPQALDSGLSALALGREGSALTLGGMQVEPVALDRAIAQFDLSLQMAEVDGRLLATLEYNRALFAPQTITRLADHLLVALKTLAAQPNQALSRLSLFTADECEQLLRDWNATQVAYPQNVCLHTLIEAQAARTPQAIAVSFEGRTLTYRELDRRANQLAHLLGRHRVGGRAQEMAPGAHHVGVCLERSLELVVALLAVLKAGGAYVALDPDYPLERLQFMFEDAHAPVLLTQERLIDTLALPSAQVICLDSTWAAIDAEPDVAPVSAVSAEDVAYVIYTSGSTGRPKGVMNTHRGIVNRLLWMQDMYGLTAADRVLQKTPYSFDVSVWEFFWPLLTGATLVVARPGGHRDSAYLADLIAAQGITTLHFVPSMLQAFLEEPDLARCHSLRRVICSGEALSVELQQRFFARIDAELHNLYGPTEAAVDVTYWACRQFDSRRSVPIGRPVANTQIYLLDGRLEPVPIGIPGELFIGGVQLARGYLNRPDLTAEKFIPDPYSAIAQGAPGARLYRTGDLARYRPDGAIEYLGRIDHQVKVRGFRIELGEIESMLLAHPAVREAVVVARPNAQGMLRLVAYVVENKEQTNKEQTNGCPKGAQSSNLASTDSSSVSSVHCSLQDLRAFLGERLPDYMVPSAFVLLDALPLTPNGKLDRKALPDPQAERHDSAADGMLPRSSAEAALAAIWREVLGVERIGIHDNFFALGGDSILSLLVVSKAQQAGLRLTPRQLFQHQTIAELAAVAAEAPLAQAQQEPVIGPVPLTPIQHWFFEQNITRPAHWNQSLLLTAEQPLDPALVEQSLRHVLIHHDALRLRFTRTAPGWEQFNAAFDEAIPLQVFDLADLSAAEVEAAITARTAEMQAGLDLNAGPLMRVGLWLRGVQSPSTLVIVLHHLVVDGVSWQILLEDFQHAYRELAQDRRPVLPPKTTSFKAWAERLITIDTIPVQELGYWREIAGETYAMLPVDVPGAANTEALARTISVSLDAGETSALLQEAAQSYRAGINDLLLTALALALHQWSGSRLLLVDLEGHGRDSGFEDIDLSRTVGWLTTLFPVRLSVDASGDPAALVAAIKEQLRRMPQGGQHYGLIRYLDRYPELAAELRSAPQAEILFNYLGQSRQLLQPGSLFGHVQPASGPARDPDCHRRYLLEINGIVVDGCLSFDWIYGSAVHHEATIAVVAQGFIAALRTILALRNSPGAQRLTLADVPQARITQAELDTIREQIERRGSSIADVYELTPLQQGMLFHALYAPASGVYVEQLVCTVQGDFKLNLFSAAWRAVAERHAVLRTTFCRQDLDKPLQVVLSEIDLDLGVEDWRALLPEVQQERLAAWLQADRVRGFDLGLAPLFRLALFQLEVQTYQLVLTHHHLLLDGWSLSQVVQEAFVLYNRLNRDQSPLLPASRPFRDYIAWLQARQDAGAETFWRAALSGFDAPSRVLGDRGMTDHTTQREDAYAELEIACSAETTTALQSLARDRHLTLNTIVQGAWALLLSRYGATSDVLFGTTVAGRPAELSGVESMVGLFANTLPLRVQIDADATLEEWLRQLQSQQAEWREYEHTSLVAIQGWSDVPRGTPLFDSLLVFENYPSSAYLGSESGLDVVDLRFVGGRTNYPLTLLALPGKSLQLRLIYDRERFDESSARHVLDQLRAMLGDISEWPEQPLAALPLLRSATLAITATFTAEPVAESLEFWLQELDLPARVEFAPYNQLFQQLLDPASLAAGNRRGLNVALIRLEDWLDPAQPAMSTPVLDRNLQDLSAAVRQATSRWQVPLLILLCPSSARIASDAALHADLIAREHWLVAELADVSGVSVLTSAELLALYPVADYDDPHADALGHVPYTEAMFAALGTLIARRFSALQRPPAKVIALDCDNTLWRGVCGEDGPLGVVIDPPRRALQEFIVERQQAGWLICLCSKNNEADALEVFDRREDMPLKREHLVAWQINWQAKSENLRALAQKLNLGLDSFIFIDDNPLECAEVAANCPQTLVLQLPSDDPWIPSALRHFWAFDQGLRTQEDTSRTAMYQAQSRREDLRQSAATLEDFLARLELEIDIAPLQAQHLDRAAQLTQRTNQFNLTTIRRSQGEVQQTLRDGAEWLVVHVRDRFGDYGLVGAIMFTVGEDALVVDTLLLSCRAMGRGVEHRMVAVLGKLALERGLSQIELRFAATAKNRPATDFLAEIRQSYRHTESLGASVRLPAEVAAQVAYRPGSAVTEAMPVAETVPLMPTTIARFQATQLQRIAHELDRADLVLARLRSRKRSRPPAADSYIAPRTDEETLLAEIWADVLRLERVGAHDHFFALGGHSLLATQIASRIYETFGVALPLRALFEAPTVAELAEQVQLARQSAAGQRVAFERVPAGEPLRLSYAQERLWLLAQIEPESPAYNIPVAMRLQGAIDPSVLERSLNEVVSRHAVLRTTFVQHGPHPVQVIAPSLWVTMPLIDLSAQPEPEPAAQQWIVEEARRPFDLQRDPPLRPALLRLDVEEHILLLTLHHIAADGWSMGVLIREMIECYTSLSADLLGSQGTRLPDLAWQYADYAYWQRRWLSQGSPSVLDQLTAHWTRQLAGAPPMLELRTDRPRPPVQSSRGAHLAHVLPADLLDQLLARSRSEGATLFMVLLAALNVLLHHETGLDDIVVGSDVANRNRAETEPLIGFFVNQLVLRTSLAGNPSFQTLLKRVRDTALEAYAHQDIPFDKLVAALKQERSFKHAPVFQVKLVLQNAPLPEIDLPGLTLQPLPVDLGTSQLDLNIRASQRPDGLVLSAEYNTDLFDPDTIVQLLRQLEVVLQAVVAQPDLSLDALRTMLTEADRRHRSSKKTALKASSLQNLRQTKRRALRDTSVPDADERA
jgi:amino acid adenylation domain-containing protein/FkbH-like protein/non-ribosomal peptide synthase protein (TIGR01720 family)